MHNPHAALTVHFDVKLLMIVGVIENDHMKLIKKLAFYGWKP